MREEKIKWRAWGDEGAPGGRFVGLGDVRPGEARPGGGSHAETVYGRGGAVPGARGRERVEGDRWVTK